MPLITRTFIKTGLIAFVLALIAGVITAARSLLPLPSFVAGLTPIYFHLFMVGWVLQLIMGIVYWMFPKYSREKPRGHDELAWAAYALLNGGLLLRVIGEPALAAAPEGPWGVLLAASAVLQWLAGLLFVVNTWPRVKER
jgi:hypothetical protein